MNIEERTTGVAPVRQDEIGVDIELWGKGEQRHHRLRFDFEFHYLQTLSRIWSIQICINNYRTEIFTEDIDARRSRAKSDIRG